MVARVGMPREGGHPVNPDAGVKFPAAANTGSSAFADDDKSADDDRAGDYCSSISLPSANSQRCSRDKNDMPKRLSLNAPSGSTMAVTLRTVMSSISTLSSSIGAALTVPLAVLTSTVNSLCDG